MKKLLNKILALGYKSDITSTNSEEKKRNKINNVATKILVEFILCDGVMDPQELKELNKILLSMNIKININDLVEETKNQSSFYEQVSEINNLYSINMKIDLMTKIWSIVKVLKKSVIPSNLLVSLSGLTKITGVPKAKQGNAT